MAIRKRTRRSHRHRHHHSGANNSGETPSEARLAPPEERSGASVMQQSSGNSGTLTVPTGELKLPQNLNEEEDDQAFRVDPFVFAMLCISLVFILAIAYVIWSGWEPPK